MVTHLSALKTGVTARIISIQSDEIATRLIAMGLAQGSEVSVQRKALFGNTLYIKSGNLRMGLRKEEADVITVSYEE
ncbi:MAG: ferrous iron transport protein A [Saprospiraceae bacterium]|jgi:Fe2+ transport system protein FeoA|nr:ferrous iron transport protein A [Saprospiraceae bacterium]